MVLESDPALLLQDVAVAHAGHCVVEAVSGRFARGAMSAICGPNGAGKSSLLAVLAGQQPPAAGQVTLGAGLVGRVGWLPQRSTVDRSFPISVDDFAAMGLWPRTGALRGLGAEGRAALQTALGHVGLDGHGRRLIGELSVGQFQRLLFARLLLQDAALWLLDEPFAALDERATDELMALLDGWRAEGRTIVCVLHEIALVRERFDDVLLLARTPVAWGPPHTVLGDAAWAEARRRLADAACPAP